MASHPGPSTDVDDMEESIRLLRTLLRVLLRQWPPDIRLILRTLETHFRALDLRHRLTGGSESEAWKAAAATVLEDFRHAMNTREVPPDDR